MFFSCSFNCRRVGFSHSILLQFSVLAFSSRFFVSDFTFFCRVSLSWELRTLFHQTLAPPLKTKTLDQGRPQKYIVFHCITLACASNIKPVLQTRGLRRFDPWYQVSRITKRAEPLCNEGLLLVSPSQNCFAASTFANCKFEKVSFQLVRSLYLTNQRMNHQKNVTSLEVCRSRACVLWTYYFRIEMQVCLFQLDVRNRTTKKFVRLRACVFFRAVNVWKDTWAPSPNRYEYVMHSEKLHVSTPAIQNSLHARLCMYKHSTFFSLFLCQE